MGNSQLTASQLQAIDIATRVSACLSICGALFTLSSYTLHSPLRTPFNRLAVCIAFANLIICTGYSWGMYPMRAGGSSPWCQTQAFFIYCFAMSDPLLVLVMVASVYLRILGRFSRTTITRFENVGITCGYVIPLILAVTWASLRPDGRRVYGPAGTWCFVTESFNTVRIAAFYAPVWCILLCSIVLIALSTRRILRIRWKVKTLQAQNDPEQGNPKLTISNFIRITRARSRTQTSQSSEGATSQTPFTKSASSAGAEVIESDAGSATHMDMVQNSENSTVTASQQEDDDWEDFSSAAARQISDLSPVPTNLPVNLPQQQQRKQSRRDTLHWKYARFAFLCTLVLCMTWVPVSISRVYNGFFHAGNPAWGLYFASALCSPLHGFGNFIVYINTSWPECRAWGLLLYSRLRRRKSIASY